MHVVATAGHVDHGKSTLVDALTGMRSDRLAEERRRGLSIELGYTWTTLPGTGDVAFVDVPGHERFVTTMLAGVGPVPVALLVVAADDPWMPQAAEHLAALDALGVGRCVVAVTRSDLADPGPAAARAAAELAPTSLAGAPVVPVSARTGAGLPELRAALAETLAALPDPDPGAPVRLWVDRRFTVRGSGTVVTATLPAGTVTRGDVLRWRGGTARVRGVQSLGAPATAVQGVARVALNLVGDGLDGSDPLERGDALTTPDAFTTSDVVDVEVLGEGDLPAEPVLHVGATAVSVHVRPLAGSLVRLRLARPLPWHVSDRGLLRDPGSRRVWGVRVLDPLPPELERRGAARERARALTDRSLAGEVTRRRVVDRDSLRRLGLAVPDPVPDGVVAAGSWLLAATAVDRAADELRRLVTEHDRRHPLDPGIATTALAERLAVPLDAVPALVRPPLRVAAGRVVAGGAGLPADLERALAELSADLERAPYDAPTAGRLVELGLDDRRQAAAARAGRLLRLAPGVVLLPGADDTAAEVLAGLEQPFTTSTARQALGTSRRTALPLLDHLDRTGRTRRLPDDRREVR